MSAERRLALEQAASCSPTTPTLRVDHVVGSTREYVLVAKTGGDGAVADATDPRR